jgi:hypothetical protein
MNRATPDQVRALLQVFGGNQGSEISHPHRLPSNGRPACLVPMRYTIIEGHPTLSATFSRGAISGVGEVKCGREDAIELPSLPMTINRVKHVFY